MGCQNRAKMTLVVMLNTHLGFFSGLARKIALFLVYLFRRTSSDSENKEYTDRA